TLSGRRRSSRPLRGRRLVRRPPRRRRPPGLLRRHGRRPHRRPPLGRPARWRPLPGIGGRVPRGAGPPSAIQAAPRGVGGGFGSRGRAGVGVGAPDRLWRPVTGAGGGRRGWGVAAAARVLGQGAREEPGDVGAGRRGEDPQRPRHEPGSRRSLDPDRLLRLTVESVHPSHPDF
ncbi:hypothetical protein MUK42_36741, partial [Musa troglodytarum]